MKKVWIEPGCIGCEVCKYMAPEVFEVKENVSKVKNGVDLEKNKKFIKQAAKRCPVKVIKYEE
jgi:ferredoxin